MTDKFLRSPCSLQISTLPDMYTRYSVAGYGTHTPNFFLVQQYGGGDVNKCVDDNQWCWTCEPPSEGTTIDSFAVCYPRKATSRQKDRLGPTLTYITCITCAPNQFTRGGRDCERKSFTLQCRLQMTPERPLPPHFL